MNTLSTKQAKWLYEKMGWDWDEKWLGADVKPRKRRRSVDANARYWVIVTALADYMGDTKMGVHESLLMEHHGSEIIQTPRGPKEVPLGRSSKLNHEDFSALMMIAERWASLGGVQWDREAA